MRPFTTPAIVLTVTFLYLFYPVAGAGDQFYISLLEEGRKTSRWHFSLIVHNKAPGSTVTANDEFAQFDYRIDKPTGLFKYHQQLRWRPREAHQRTGIFDHIAPIGVKKGEEHVRQGNKEGKIINNVIAVLKGANPMPQVTKTGNFRNCLDLAIEGLRALSLDDNQAISTTDYNMFNAYKESIQKDVRLCTDRTAYNHWDNKPAPLPDPTPDSEEAKNCIGVQTRAATPKDEGNQASGGNDDKGEGSSAGKEGKNKQTTAKRSTTGPFKNGSPSPPSSKRRSPRLYTQNKKGKTPPLTVGHSKKVSKVGPGQGPMKF
ncbi:hypothetical protein CC2G_004836 [Coprinopsis cinerea AmutBmut pab1-1]|nr:hypothetical protein CC2G_004836 [Coprinopsis cinerea AmutBmut pab1-1]